MKRIVTTLLALSLFAGTSAMAAPHDHDRDRDHDRREQSRDHRGKDDHRQPPRKGQHLAKGHRGAEVRDYHRHGLHKPGRGQQWRRVDDRYVLISVASGLIAEVLNAR